MKIENVKIESFYLGFGDGIFRFHIRFKIGGSVQSVPLKLEQLPDILKVLGVDEIQLLPGLFCRIQASHSHIKNVGHIVDDRWLQELEDV